MDSVYNLKISCLLFLLIVFVGLNFLDYFLGIPFRYKFLIIGPFILTVISIATHKKETTNPKIIVIEGIIGSGKSTLVKNLSAHLKSLGYSVAVALEPVDEWVKSGLLQQFYSNKQRFAYLFQTAVFVDQTNVYFDAVNKPVDYVIIERSLLSNTIFAELLHEEESMTDLEMRQYSRWAGFWHKTLNISPSHFIYLSPSVETAMTRLRSRGRDGESGISADYQARLKQKHDLLFGKREVKYGKKEVPVLQLDDNHNLEPIIQFIK